MHTETVLQWPGGRGDLHHWLVRHRRQAKHKVSRCMSETVARDNHTLVCSRLHSETGKAYCDLVVPLAARSPVVLG